jgi:hypothetical protein
MVWALKVTLGIVILLPTIFSAHDAIEDSFPQAPLVDAGALTNLSIWMQPAHLLRIVLIAKLWFVSLIIWITDTLLWYSAGVGLWGGIVGLRRHGIGRDRSQLGKDNARDMKVNAVKKLLPMAHRDAHTTSWKQLWRAITNDLYERDLLSAHEKRMLLAADGEIASDQLLASPLRVGEAHRRLAFFSHSLADPLLPEASGALSSPGMTVLVPHYGESILLPASAIKDNVAPPKLVGTANFEQQPAGLKAKLTGAGSAGRMSSLTPMSPRPSPRVGQPGAAMRKMSSVVIDVGKNKGEDTFDIMAVLVRYFPQE